MSDIELNCILFRLNWINIPYNSAIIFTVETQKTKIVTYGRLLVDIWQRKATQLGTLQVAEQSLNPQSWTCLNIRHAGPWVRNKERAQTCLSMAQGCLCVSEMFPESLWNHAANLPKSKWNPTWGPCLQLAPTASGRAPRFYVQLGPYESSYIAKYRSVP